LRSPPYLLILLPLLASLAHADDDDAAAPAPAVTARVRTVAVSTRHFVSSVSGYGLVSGQPGAQLTLSRAVPGQVQNLHVSPGQTVQAGEALLDFIPDAATGQAWTQAQTAVSYARRELKRQRQLLQEHLSTQGQVDAAEHALRDAMAASDSLQAQGADQGRHVISAPFAGVITTVTVASGDRVAAGAPLLQLAANGKSQILLGIQPAQAAAVKPGQTVELLDVFSPEQHWQGHVLHVAGQINAQSHLLDVSVQLPAGGPLAGSRLQGSILLGGHDQQAVPRTALINDEQGTALYTITAGKAHRIKVSTGPDEQGWTPLNTPLPAGSKVVVEGQYTLDEGMAVKETP
jgi:RND family efflux transporter MFP subunit